MKKLATLVAVCTLSIAAPVFACPHSDKAESDAPRTAEKTEKTDTAKEKTADKAKTKTDKAEKTEKAPAKTAEKVSSK